MLTYFDSFRDENNYIYSCDMVRLNFTLCIAFDFSNWLDSYYDDIRFSIKFFINKKSVGYKYLYNIAIDDGDFKCSFAIGLCLNSLAENNLKGFIEFNPNKCMKLQLFYDFYCSLFAYLQELSLVRFDVAIDIPINRKYCKLKRNYRCNYDFEIVESKIGDNLNRSLTEYQGRRNNNKFTKLYDKKAESHLDYDLTRLEYTFTADEKDFDSLAEVHIYDEQIVKDLQLDIYSSTDFVLADLLRNSPDMQFYLKTLDYRKRKKLLPLLDDYYFSPKKENIKRVKEIALEFLC